MAASPPGAPLGLWHCRLVPVEAYPVLFDVRIKAKGHGLAARLINGDAEEPFSGASWDGATLTLEMAQYDAKIVARQAGEGLSGMYTRVLPQTTAEVTFAASRAAPPLPNAARSGASVAGSWDVEIAEEGGVTKGTGVFRQKGVRVTGTLLTTTGDYGPLHGTFDGENLILTVFNGVFVYRFDGSLLPDGSLRGEFRARTNPPADWRATRRAKGSGTGLPPAFEVVRPKDASAPYLFTANDLDGKEVSSTDPPFKGKPMVVTLMGTWCPNCHDEAPVLDELYGRYHWLGLEVVGLSFEYTDDMDRDRRQVGEFVRRHRLHYPILVAGTAATGRSSPLVTPLEGWQGYPTTLFMDKDHRIVAIQSGFDGPATGARFGKTKREMDEAVRKLLPPPPWVLPGSTSLTLH